VGGKESVVRLLAIGQRDRGHSVRVAAIVDGIRAHPFVTELNAAGVETVPLTLPPRAYLRERAQIAELCARHRPSVVHTHGYRADVLDAGVARRQRIPTVTTVHGFAAGDWKNRLYERVQRMAFRAFDAVVAVSRPLVENLKAHGVPIDRIHLVPNAYAAGPMFDRESARRALSIAEGEFVIGWVGRLSSEKGADVMVDALARLTSLPVRVLVFGDGREREALHARATALGVESRITWHGIVHDAASRFRAFDVFVLSSRTEGAPIVLFEAMAAGVPIVATRVGGVPDILSSAEAILVPAENSAALAEAILQVHHDPDSAATRAYAACDRLRAEFQSDAWVSRYESLYERLQAARAAGGS
jgi:glycosyltransferase involved in cell wall biosynthesis